MKNKTIKEKARFFLSKKLHHPLCPPRNVTLTLNYLCNQRCIMCDIKEHAFDKSCEIRPDEIKRIIDEMVAMEIPELVITGGEPFLYKDIFEVIAYGKQRGRKIVMITNGFYGDKVVDPIIRSGVDHLQISLDGSNKEIYEKIRGAEESFGIVTSNIKKLTQSGKSVGVTATLVRQNYRDLVSIARLAKDLGCSRLALRPAHISNADPLSRDFMNSPFWIPQEEIPALREVLTELKKINEKTNFIDFQPGLDLLADYFENGYLPGLKSCYIGFTRLIISYDERGSYGVWMCGGMAGDIRKRSLKEIWYGKEATALRRKIARCKKACLFPESHEPDLENFGTFMATVMKLMKTPESEGEACR
ncbi:MAG: radical SAM protein [Candidatus Omnitrophota bacterium]